MPAVFGIRFSLLNKNALVELFATEPVPCGAGVRLVVTANLDHVVNLSRNPRFRDAYRSAWLTTADGAPISLYAKLRGVPLPERVVGSDLFAGLMLALAAGRHRPFFVVSTPGTGERLKSVLVERGFASDAVGLEAPPFGFERNATYSAALARRIRDHRPTHLVLGVGSPKSEIWVDEWREQLGDCYAFGIGSGIDYFAGTARRAPAWMRRLGLEWSWRFAHEPRRLFRRYLVDAWLFPLAIGSDLVHAWRKTG